MIKHFKNGEILFEEGDTSDSVLKLARGKVKILGHHGNQPIVLGHVNEGEFLGEMAAIEHRRHGATAQAVSDGEAEVISVPEFLDRISYQPKTARETILRLSIRLRQVENRLIAEHGPQDQAPSPRAVGPDLRVTLAARTDALRTQMGRDTIHIASFPFIVGRAPLPEETTPLQHPNLVVVDKRPFRLSRDHFLIERNGSGVFVHDLNSTLGTIVNARAIGRHFPADTAELARGENTIIAGGSESPFEFSVVVS